MTRLARTLCVFYTGAALWLAWLTISTFGHWPLWASILNFAFSICAVMAVVNTSADADDMRDLRVQLERATRPAPPADTTSLTQAEAQAFAEIEAHYRKDEAA